jgi:hypothetical protein
MEGQFGSLRAKLAGFLRAVGKQIVIEGLRAETSFDSASICLD